MAVTSLTQAEQAELLHSLTKINQITILYRDPKRAKAFRAEFDVEDHVEGKKTLEEEVRWFERNRQHFTYDIEKYLTPEEIRLSREEAEHELPKLLEVSNDLERRDNGAYAEPTSGSINFGVTRSFAFKITSYSLMIAASGGITPMMIAAPIISHTLLPYISTKVYPVLQRSEAYQKMTQSIGAFLSRVSHKLGFEKLKEKLPDLPYSSLCKTLGVAVVAAGLGVSGDALAGTIDYASTNPIDSFSDMNSHLNDYSKTLGFSDQGNIFDVSNSGGAPSVDGQSISDIAPVDHSDALSRNVPQDVNVGVNSSYQPDPLSLSERNIPQDVNTSSVEHPAISTELKTAELEITKASLDQSIRAHLLSTGIDFDGNLESVVAHVRQEIATLNPELESVHKVTGGQVLIMPEIANAADVDSLLERVSITHANDVSQLHEQYSKLDGGVTSQIADLANAEQGLASRSVDAIDVSMQPVEISYSAVNPDQVKAVISERWPMAPAEFDFELPDNAKAMAFHLLAQSQAELFYDPATLEALASELSNNIYENTSPELAESGGLNVPTDMDQYIREVAGHNLDPNVIGGYVIETAVEPDHSPLIADANGYITSSSEVTLYEAAATLAKSYAESAGYTGTETGELYQTLLKDLKEVHETNDPNALFVGVGTEPALQEHLASVEGYSEEGKYDHQQQSVDRPRHGLNHKR